MKFLKKPGSNLSPFMQKIFAGMFLEKHVFEMIRSLLNKTSAIPVLILLGLFTAFDGNGQSQINGIILDGSGKPIAYANVLLLSAPDSMVIKGAVSEGDGSFLFNDLENAEYLLSVAMIGYKKYWDHLTVLKLRPVVCGGGTIKSTGTI